ncbi:MAG: DNA-3-methyladenine glycosylase 2 family protein [Candidatus Riflebacteria bacterium]|nr:DNA-3-methyladenine glycosylase 2 family protein [Candidatus Riflebacteria bacterium]
MQYELEKLNIKQVISYLSEKDPLLGAFLSEAPEFNIRIDPLLDPYTALIESIISQQITGKAAKTIYNRLLAYFSSTEARLNPLDILRADESELKSVGLSRPKCNAVKSLSEFYLDNKLPDICTLLKMKNEDIISLLTQIKGIGRWTVEMLLIFRLGRQDIMPATDHGIKKGFTALYKDKKATPRTIAAYAEDFYKPYKTVASWYLWRLSETIKT